MAERKLRSVMLRLDSRVMSRANDYTHVSFRYNSIIERETVFYFLNIRKRFRVPEPWELDI